MMRGSLLSTAAAAPVAAAAAADAAPSCSPFCRQWRCRKMLPGYLVAAAVAPAAATFSQTVLLTQRSCCARHTALACPAVQEYIRTITVAPAQTGFGFTFATTQGRSPPEVSEHLSPSHLACSFKWAPWDHTLPTVGPPATQRRCGRRGT
jgi:hypothetical protein